MNVAIVSAAARIALNGANKINSARIVLGAVAPTPLRLYAAEEILLNQGITDQTLEDICELASSVAAPITDFRSTQDYRLKIVKVLTRRAVQQAWERATQAGGD
jgi:CO/xanthine dehydrogenase FAD-binding subunit